jgi:hypothetical protein
MIATDVSARPVATTQRIAAALFIAALAYPLLLRFLFLVAAEASTATGTVAPEHGPVLALAFALPFAVPCMGVMALLAMRGQEGMDATRVRRLALLVVAVPPLFTAIGNATFLAGIGAWDHIVWWAAWMASIPLWLQVRTKAELPIQVPPFLRIGHGIAALLVLVGYVGMHLGNHLVAWWGPEAHRSVQLVLRTWYRAPLVEVSLVVLLAWLIGSGVALLRIYSRRPDMDGFRILQVALGANLGAFVFSHLMASLWVTRGMLGSDPDWKWAAGGDAGLLGDPWNVRLIPHYFLAVLAVLSHVGLGARIVALRHGASKAAGHFVVAGFGGAGVLMALALTAALLGARL